MQRTLQSMQINKKYWHNTLMCTIIKRTLDMHNFIAKYIACAFVPSRITQFTKHMQ
jgi:hypothetical protein